MICTEINEHMKSLIRELEILWSVILNDGTEVFSDYNAPGLTYQPWLRLQEYCNTSNKYIIQVNCIMFGADKKIIFEDKNGLDGIFVHRGVSKDIVLNDDESGDTGISYKQLIVGLWRNGTNIIDVKKFSWPENDLEPYNQTRSLTVNNIHAMIFKNEQSRQEAYSKL